MPKSFASGGPFKQMMPSNNYNKTENEIAVASNVSWAYLYSPNTQSKTCFVTFSRSLRFYILCLKAQVRARVTNHLFYFLSSHLREWHTLCFSLGLWMEFTGIWIGTKIPRACKQRAAGRQNILLFWQQTQGSRIHLLLLGSRVAQFLQGVLAHDHALPLCGTVSPRECWHSPVYPGSALFPQRLFDRALHSQPSPEKNTHWTS